MIPLWKVRRELYRFAEYAWSLAGHVYEPFLRLRHDRWRKALAVPHEGGVPLGAKIAIVLLYQPKGISASTLGTLRHLAEKGYGPLAISNAPLAEADRDLLHPLTWRIVERPNFGYDFGGYRDGILLLETWGILPERLLIANDSIWFPLCPGSTLIDRLEASDGDLVGGFLHPDTIRKRSGTMRKGFVESYLYLINRAALRHPAFAEYWRRYRVSSNKLNAIYRGERGFPQRLREKGLTVTGLFSAAGLLDMLASESSEFLRRTLLYGAYMDADLEAERDALLTRDSGTPDWRGGALAHIARTVARRRFNASFPYPSGKILGMDFMKKSAGPSGAGSASLHSRMRTQYLRAVAAGDLPAPYPEVLAEIEAREPIAK